MENFFSDLIKIELALTLFNSSDTYSAGLALFNALDYPVKPIEGIINEDIKQFIYFSEGRSMQFSLEEMDYLNSVESISILFEIQSKDINCRDYQDPNGYFKKTRFIAIKMECLKEERSINAFSVTKILNKIYPYPVFILFSHNNYIMFSSLLYKDVHNV